MKTTKLTRREFLKLMGVLTVGKASSSFPERLPLEDQEAMPPAIKTVRVAIRKDEIRREPSLESEVVDIRRRDELVSVYEEFVSPNGPEHNPRWYKVVGGYMHTAHLAPVETHLNKLVPTLREGGQVFEVTVPFTQTLRLTDIYGWQPLYRLYYQSTHWVTSIEEGPDGTPWYVITDDLLKVEYFAPAAHLRVIPDEEFAPIRPELTNKWIQVSLKDQMVTCYEGDTIVLQTKVSTGIPSLQPTTNGIPTETPRGEFNVTVKAPVRHMGDGKLTDDIHAYELPGVPWSTFFTDTGVAFHGTFWHDNYGGRMSHGCVNMRVDEAKWLYRWTTPEYIYQPGQWYQNGFGTSIYVI